MVSILFLTEFYNSLRGFLLYFRSSCWDECYSSYSIELLLVSSGDPTKWGPICSFWEAGIAKHDLYFV